MNFLKKIVDLGAAILDSPNSVKQLAKTPDLSNKVIIFEKSGLQLYKDKNYVYMYLFVGKHVFQLFYASLSLLPTAIRLFNNYRDLLLHLCDHVYKDMTYPLSYLQKSCELIQNNSDSWSPLHVAVATGLKGIYSINTFSQFLNLKDKIKGESPLHLAIRLKNECIADELITAGSLTLIENKLGETPLHYAVQQNVPELLKILCDKSIEPRRLIETKDSNGNTALHIASRNGSLDCVKVLIENGSDIFSVGELGLPIHYALKYKHTDVLKLLVEQNAGCVFIACKIHGGLPLHWCKTQQDAKVLFENGTPYNHASFTGDHPIHIMSQRGRLEVAIELVLKNADINARGKHGNTPLHVAINEDQHELVKMLLLFGGDLSLVNDFNETPYLVALRSNKPNGKKILKILAPDEFKENSVIVNGYVNPTNCVNMFCTLESLKQRPTLLCLDGGGIRGLVLTQILIEIEKQTGKKCRELFDWIAGTSTGGILAIALAQGKSAVDCQRLYFEMKDKVFVGKRPYDAKPLEEFLKKEFGKNTTMSSLKSKVIIPATLADRKPFQLHLFTNYVIPESDSSCNSSQFKFSSKLSKKAIEALMVNQTPQDQLLWKVGRATGAAPTFFCSYENFIDGGLLANNPTLEAMTEAHNYYKNQCFGSRDNMDTLGLVLSVGTGQLATSKVERSLDVNPFSMSFDMIPTLLNLGELSSILVDAITESNGHIVNRARAWCESQQTSYFRLNPFLDTEIEIDQTDNAILLDLLWETQNYLRNNKKTIQEISSLLNQMC